MKRAICCFLAALTGLACLSGCAGEEGEEEARLTVVASTYPVYLLAREVAAGVEGVAVERLNTGSVSCLHDYTLSVGDVKKLERADVVALNGVGLEDFMTDALAASAAPVIDCSAGVELLESLAHDHAEGDEDHDHGHWDPHIWMDPDNAAVMAGNLAEGLAAADPANAARYRDNGEKAQASLAAFAGEARALAASAREGREGTEIGLVTFHDGFQYFARAFGLPLLAAIEEEAGSEASAKEIVEITKIVKEYDLPVIFAEVNGSDATARAISRETGCAVAQLSMLMDGPEDGTLYDNYYAGLKDNVAAIVNGFAGEELQ